MDDDIENQMSDEIKPEQTLLVWKAPSRLFKKRDMEFYKNVGAIVLLLLVIFIFAKEFLLALAILSVVFFVYVTSTVPPEDVEYRITTFGIEGLGTFYHWEDLSDFWFEEQWGQVKMTIDLKPMGRIFMLLGDQNPDKVKEIISEHIPYLDKPQKTWMDKTSTWISEKIPLEKSS